MPFVFTWITVCVVSPWLLWQLSVHVLSTGSCFRAVDVFINLHPACLEAIQWLLDLITPCLLHLECTQESSITYPAWGLWWLVGEYSLEKIKVNIPTQYVKREKLLYMQLDELDLLLHKQIWLYLNVIRAEKLQEDKLFVIKLTFVLVLHQFCLLDCMLFACLLFVSTCNSPSKFYHGVYKIHKPFTEPYIRMYPLNLSTFCIVTNRNSKWMDGWMDNVL